MSSDSMVQIKELLLDIEKVRDEMEQLDRVQNDMRNLLEEIMETLSGPERVQARKLAEQYEI